MLEPVVLVLLSRTCLKQLQSVLDQIRTFRDILDARWHFVHLASVFCLHDDAKQLDDEKNVHGMQHVSGSSIVVTRPL